MAQRERDYNERQDRDRRERDQYSQAPHQNNAGSLPIHQPVASRLAGAMHSPGGLLATHGGPPPAGPLGAPSGPGNTFGGPLHAEPSRAVQHNPPPAPAQLQQHQGFGASILNHNPPSTNAPLGGPGGGAGPGFGATLQQQQQEAAARLQHLVTPGHQLPVGTPAVGQGGAIGQGGQQPILNVSYFAQFPGGEELAVAEVKRCGQNGLSLACLFGLCSH